MYQILIFHQYITHIYQSFEFGKKLKILLMSDISRQAEAELGQAEVKMGLEIPSMALFNKMSYLYIFFQNWFFKMKAIAVPLFQDYYTVVVFPYQCDNENKEV